MAFRWAPAHCIPRYTDIHLCVTFEKNKVKFPVGHLEGERGAHFSERSVIRCPDRTLIVYTHPKYRPLNTSFDIGINLSVFDNNSPFNDIRLGLIAAEFSDIVDRYPFTIPKGHILIGDSGGFQLRIGKLSFLDPFKVIDWFNRSAITHGMSVDVSPRFYQEDNPEIPPSLYAAKKCNGIFKAYRRSDLNLVNVVHGYTPNQKKEWADYLNDEAFEGWASGSEGGTLMNCYSIMMLHDKYPRKYYHLFGIGATTNVFYLSWLGKYVPLLTSDSTTYRNSGMSREIQLMYPSGIVRMFHTGKIKEYPENVATHVPCSCPVCNVVRYIDVYGLPSRYKTERLLTWHNMLVLHNQAKFWNEIALNSSYEEYLHTIRESLSNTPGVRGVNIRFEKIKTILDIIEMYKNEGEKKTAKHYTPIVLSAFKASETSSLSVMDLFAPSITEKKARTLKSKNPYKSESGFISVDCLPNYIPLSKLESSFDISLKHDEDYLEYKSKIEIEKKKILKEKKTLEGFHKGNLRKHPHKVLKQLRKHRLERGGK